MTDVLDHRPAAVEPEAQAEAEAARPDREEHESAATTPTARPEHWLLATLLLCAGAIHVAMAPSHFGESGLEGAGFLAAAWAQLILAVAVLLRPTRRVLNAVAASSLTLIAAWLVSRTAGLPFGPHAGHPESVSIVDGVCVAVEGLAVIVALGFLPRIARGKRVVLAGVVGVLAFSTAAVASPAARDHAAHSHGDHATASDQAAAGHDHGAAAADDLGFSELANGHQHEHGSDEPLTTEERVTLAQQLAVTAELVEQYPTIADAEAAGWRRAGPFSPGLGTHYRSPDFVMNADGDMDREDLLHPMLVFDGVDPDSPLAGFMYVSYGSRTEPAGFPGDNDHWHYHERVCIVTHPDGTLDTPFGADLDGATEDMCTEVGGQFIAFTGYMVHVWDVPGYESPDGMFTELNRRITCPDGTYYRIPIDQVGERDTVCRNP